MCRETYIQSNCNQIPNYTVRLIQDKLIRIRLIDQRSKNFLSSCADPGRLPQYICKTLYKQINLSVLSQNVIFQAFKHLLTCLIVGNSLLVVDMNETARKRYLSHLYPSRLKRPHCAMTVLTLKLPAGILHHNHLQSDTL
jgi:hypothetical protein